MMAAVAGALQFSLSITLLPRIVAAFKVTHAFASAGAVTA